MHPLKSPITFQPHLRTPLWNENQKISNYVSNEIYIINIELSTSSIISASIV